MAHTIQRQNGCTEVYVSGKLDHWDALKIVHDLYKNDPHKETPDLWILDPNLDFSFHSFPPVIEGILKLVSRGLKKGCRSAILAADEFQRVKVDLFCREAAALPYEIQAFTDRDEATQWLRS
jgi:hypothetical protein